MGIPLVLGGIMYVATKDQTGNYTSSTTIFTAITSNVSVENIGGNRVDQFAAAIAYNNLMSIIESKRVTEETGLRLLARHLQYTNPQFDIISQKSFKNLHDMVPEEVKDLVVPGNEERTYQNFMQYLRSDKENFLYNLLNLKHPHYSRAALSKISTSRQRNSDLLKISYESDDAGVCYQTLNILLEVFVRVNASMKQDQTYAAVSFFEKQLEDASEDLRLEEERLLQFNTRNEIINYYEQTKFIAGQQEKIDFRVQEIAMDLEASKAVVEALETETKNRFNINLRNKSILDLREELIDVNSRLVELEIEGSSDERLGFLKQRQLLEAKLEEQVDSLYIYEHNSEGIEIERLLDDWLKNVIEFESAKARLNSMEIKQVEFMKTYRRFAPMGAILKRIERKINVNERAYLNILHHLGLARLKLQNVEMMSDMKILDSPTLPIEPNPTKGLLLTVAVIIAAGIFTCLAIFVLELLDQRIRNGTKLRKLTNLESATAFAKEFTPNKRKYDFELLRYRSTRFMVDHITLNVPPRQVGQPSFIMLLSHWNQEGKSYMRQQLMNQLAKGGHFCFSIVYDEKDVATEGYPYIVLNTNDLDEFDSFKDYLKVYHPLLSNQGGYAFVEAPPVCNGLSNPILMRNCELRYLLFDATRTWSEADNTYLRKVSSLKEGGLFTILNKAQPQDMSDFMGEIPKQRNSFQKFLKYRLLKKYI